MHGWTDEDARAAERLRASQIATATGLHQCRGFPVDHYCPVLIPWTRDLCYFCAGTRDLERERIALMAASVPTVGEIIADLPPFEQRVTCACGGWLDAEYHEVSLMHLQWLQAKGALQTAEPGVVFPPRRDGRDQ